MITSRFTTSCFLAAVLLAAALPVRANPKGGQVTNGAITITEGAGTMTINQATPRGIIHWQDFSIGAGELTQFIHMDAKSATLNRVVGGIPSSIQGTLQANGQVYLVNPNGIVVGPGGRINTAAFVASTLDVPDAEFMAGGDMHFSGNSLQGIVNFGSITATDGDVILMAHTVTNAGTINAPNGVAALAAGNDILLQAAGDERVVVNSGIAAGGDGVVNSGTIQAAQAELKAAGGNVYALAVNNSGVIRATGIAQKNGRIILSSAGGVVQNSGELHAKNADGSGGSVRMDSGKGGQTINQGLIDAAADNKSKNGGTVEVLGDTVTVGSSSVIDVSGANAGTVAIGVSADLANQTTDTGGIATLTADASAGSSTGAGTSAAQQATIQANSRILANSSNAGNGGRVVVWSEKQTMVGGALEANGGTNGGNGGLVETSGRTGLTIIPGTKVSTAAPKGKAGTWLLDPAGITVDNNASDTANGNSSPFTQNQATNHVLAGDIVFALGLGDVTITTSGFPSNTDIVVNSAISIPTALGGNHTLAFFSAGGIDVNAAVGGAASDVILTMQTHGDVNINSGGSIQMNGVSIFAITGSINVADQITALNDKNIFLNAPTGSIAFTGSGKASTTTIGAVTLDTHSSSAGTITGGSNVVVSSGSLTIGSGTQGVGSSGSPLVTSVDNLTAFVFRIPSTASSGGGVYIKNVSGGTLHIGNVLGPIVSGFGDVEINNTAGNIVMNNTVPGDHIAVQGNIKLTAGGANSDIQLLNTGTDSVHSHGGSVTLNAGRNVQIGDAFSNTWGVNVRGQTDVTVQAGGDVTVAGSLLKSGGGAGMSVTAGGDINIVNSNGFAAIIGTSGGVDISLTTGVGKTFNNNTSSTGGLLTTLPDDISHAVTASGAPIRIHADNIVFNAPVNAGTGGTLNITPLGIHTAIDIGTTAKNVADQLGISQADLSKITAGHLQIYTPGSDDGDVLVSAFTNILNTKVPRVTLEADGGGDINVDQTLSLGGIALTLNAFNNGDVGGAGSISANSLTALAPGGAISLSGSVGVDYLKFNASSSVNFNSGSNTIRTINRLAGDTSTGAFISVVTTQNLAINGTVGNGSTNAVLIQTGPSANLFFDPGAQVNATLFIALDIGGNMINNAGAGVLNSPVYHVWQADFFGPQKNEGGIPGTRDTSPPGVFFPNDPLNPDPRVFYYGNVTPPPTPVFLSGGAKVLVPHALNDQNDLSDFRAQLRSLSLDQLAQLLTDPSIKRDFTISSQVQDAIQFLISANGIAARISGEAARESAEISAHVAEIQAGADAQRTQKLAVLKSLLAPTTLDMTDAAVEGAFNGNTIPAVVAKINLGSYSVQQLQLFTRDELLSMLGSAGVTLSAEERKTAAQATMTQDQLAALINSGVNKNQFDSLIAAGAGNLSVNQIIAAGAGNLLTSDGAGLLTSDGAGFKVVDRNGKVISNDGGSLSVFELAKLITSDGAGILSHDGGTILSHDGGTIISHDGGTLQGALVSLIGHDGASILAANSNLITSDGAGLITSDGAGLITSDGAGILGHNGSALITSDGAGLARLVTAGLVGDRLITSDGAGVVSNSSSTILTNNGGTLVGERGAGIIGDHSAGVISDHSEGIIQLGNRAGVVSPLIKSGIVTENGAGLINERGSGVIGDEGSGLKPGGN